MQCLVSYADHAGRCFPSLRTFAVQAGISKSAAGRDLAELRLRDTSPEPAAPAASISTASPAGSCRAGHASRCPSSGPQAQGVARPTRGGLVGGVPERGTEEKPMKKNQGDARARDDSPNQE